MKSSMQKILLFICASLWTCQIFAEEIRWTGAINSDPSLLENWSPVQLPTVEDNVVVDAQSGAMSLLADLQVGSLTLIDAMQISLNGFTLSVGGSLDLQGSCAVNGPGEIQLAGDLMVSPESTDALSGVGVSIVGGEYSEITGDFNVNSLSIERKVKHIETTIEGQLVVLNELRLGRGELHGDGIKLHGDLTVGADSFGGFAAVSLIGEGDQRVIIEGEEPGLLCGLEVDKFMGEVIFEGAKLRIEQDLVTHSPVAITIPVTFAKYQSSRLAGAWSIHSLAIDKDSIFGELVVEGDPVVLGGLDLKTGRIDGGRLFVHGDVSYGEQAHGQTGSIVLSGEGDQLVQTSVENPGYLPGIEVDKMFGVVTFKGLIKTSGDLILLSGIADLSQAQVELVSYSDAIIDGSWVFNDLTVAKDGTWADIHLEESIIVYGDLNIQVGKVELENESTLKLFGELNVGRDGRLMDDDGTVLGRNTGKGVVSDLPTYWSLGNIGNVPYDPIAVFENGIYHLDFVGTGVGEEGDNLSYAYRKVSGDATIIARLGYLELEGRPSAKAGLMIRESMESSSAMVGIFRDYERSLRFYLRKSSGGQRYYSYNPMETIPEWMKLERKGDMLTGYYSEDGSNWTLLNSYEVSLPDEIYIGLTVHEYIDYLPVKADFYSVQVTADKLDLPPLPVAQLPDLLSSGTGLTGYYYNGMNLGDLKYVRRDPQVNFLWEGSPAPGVDFDEYSIKWMGQVEALYSEQYTFYTLSDDGVRLWINGELLIDDPQAHSPSEHTCTIQLEAGKRYDIVMDFFDSWLGGTVKLSWSSAGTPKQVIPTSQLYIHDTPFAPYSFKGVEVQEGVQLSWDPVVCYSGIKFYRLFRDGVQIAETSEIELLDSNALQGVTNYEIEAVDLKDRVSDRVSISVVPLLTVPDAAGLLGAYFTDVERTQFSFLRVDPQVDFVWARDRINGQLTGELFVEWLGWLHVPATDDYSFHLKLGDGARMWINGEKVVEEWSDMPAHFGHSAPVHLNGGENVRIRLEHYGRFSTGEIELYWSRGGNPPELIPTSCLIPEEIIPPRYLKVSYDGQYANLSWREAHSDVVTGIEYEILRNGVVIGTTSVNSFMDDLSAEAEGVFRYEVKLVGSADETKTNSVALELRSTADYAWGNGTGLRAEYYSNPSEPVLEAVRTEAQVDYDWMYGGPIDGLKDHFIGIWKGKLMALTSETYTLFLESNFEACRITVDGQLLYNRESSYRPPLRDFVSLDLTAGQLVELELYYYEYGSRADVHFSWSTPSIAKQIVPSSQLYPPGAADDRLAPARPTGLRALSVAAEKLELGWDASEEGDVAWYAIYRDGAQVGLALRNYFSDESVSPEASYSYRVVAFDQAGNPSDASDSLQVIVSPVIAAGSGTGFSSSIYSDGEMLNAVDSLGAGEIGMDEHSVIPPEAGEEFSIRWEGFLEAPKTGKYTFQLDARGGVRLYLNGKTLIDDWELATSVRSSKADLVAGQRYHLIVDYRGLSADPWFKLDWIVPGEELAALNAKYLYPLGELAGYALRVDSAVESWTSPAWVMGECGPEVGNFELQIDDELRGEVLLEGARRWHLNDAAESLPPGIELSPTSSRKVTVISYGTSGGSDSVEVNLTWKFLTPGAEDMPERLTIRKGDSLLFSVEGDMHVGLDADGDGRVDYSGLAGSKFAHRYDEAGVYVAESFNGDQVAGSVEVTVIGVEFHDPLYCETQYRRFATAVSSPYGVAEEITMTGSDARAIGEVAIESTEDYYEILVEGKVQKRGNLVGQSLRYGFRPLAGRNPELYARLNGQYGPVISRAQVVEIDLNLVAEEISYLLQEYEDGSWLVESEIIMTPRIPEIDLLFGTYTGGITFEDGSLSQLVPGSEIDPSGSYKYRTILGPNNKAYACHTIILMQDDERISR